MNMKNKVFCVLFAAVLFGTACHNEDDGPKIDKLQFSERTRTVKIGETTAVAIKVSPENAKTAEKIKYEVRSSLITIDENLSSNDGVVFTGIEGGTTVITAKAGNAVDYLNVTVEELSLTGVPYITVTDSVLEVPLGTKKHFMATLQNGNPDDYLSFVYSNKENGIVNYETANNTVVIEGLRPGSDVITARHPKAQYGADVLVFVLEAGEYAKYITGENAVFMEAGNDLTYFTRLVGIEESESGYSVYRVVEGQDVITVTGSGKFCLINSKKEGVAKVRVTNRSAPYPFDFQVIVRGSERSGYITMSSNFVILEDSSIRNIYASYIGDSAADIDDKYSFYFENDVTDIVEVIRYGNCFALKALKDGNVKLIVENEYSPVRQEVLIQVQFEKVNYGEMIITTSQNVIYMELGGVDVILKMKLVGGTLADRNSFEWTVEDSSIIEVDVPDGHGTAVHRAMINYGEIAEAEAKITAKKAGTTYITVTNPKAPRSEARVLVKVYPKGMFSGNTVSLSGPGLLKVKRGETLDVEAELIGGSYQNTGNLGWHVKDETVAEISGAGLKGALTGHKEGVTQLIVSGPNVLAEYNAVVVVYEGENENVMPYIYADRLQYRMYAGQTVMAWIYHPNIEDEVFNISIVNTNQRSVYVIQRNEVVIINAVEPGEAELVINTGIPGCNTLTLTVSVELAEINTERPYVITGDSSVVTYAGGTAEYSVYMAGAGESDLSRILWTIDDDSVVSIEMKNGANIRLRGLRTGQTVLRAESVKSANVKEIIVFVTATQNDAYNKITLGLVKINYVLENGESFFVKLVTNASETQKLQIRWSPSDADILEIEDNYDTAYITALEEGTCIITVDTRDNSHAMKLTLYVTVRSQTYEEIEFGFPSSVVLLKGQSKIIRGNVLGGSGGGFDFMWNIEDDNVAHVIGSGLEATLWGRNAGQSFLTVSHFGFSKKILVICVENENDLENIFYFTADKTYYRIKKDEEARVNLLFGENGFPEDEKKNIEWKEDLNGGVISLSYSGAGARITGKNPGVARIIASHELVGKDVEILVEVVDSVIGSDEYYMLFPAVNKMVKDVPQNITVSLYKNDHLYTQGYGLITVKTEEKGVVRAELLNDTLRVMGFEAGREYITLSHPLAGEYRMLAAVYEGEIPEEGDPVIYVDRQYWSVYGGKEVFIPLQIAGGDENTANGITWENFDPNVISVDSSDRMRARVKGLAFGGTEMDILFNGNLVEKIHVSVAKGDVNAEVVLSTESIIIMALETDAQHKTRVIGGSTPQYWEWEIENEEIAEIRAYEDQCVLYPKTVGMTELAVREFGCERKIVVVVVQTEKEKMEGRYLNVDKRYYKLKRGESTVIYPYYKMTRPETPMKSPLLQYDSGVVSAVLEDGGLVITGKNEGIELITIGNGQCKNSIQIAVEVDSKISGGVVENDVLVYMTTENNIILAPPGLYGIMVKIDIIGEYKGTNADFIWSKDSILIEWEASGLLAFINTKETAGEVNITVENKYCDHALRIKVIIQEDFKDIGTPYVYSDRTVYRLDLFDDALKVSFNVKNANNVDYSQVVFEKKGNAADISLNGDYFEARPRSQGVSELEIFYPGAISLKLFFIVSDSIENAAVYLTTSMNYVTVAKSRTRVVDVALINYVELNSENIKWQSSDYNTVTVVGAGRTVQIYGVELGFAKLTVTHPASYNDLEIMVKVVEEHDMSNVAYLTTNDNIIETFVQNSSLQVMVEKIGGKIPGIETSWLVDNPSVASVSGSGNMGYIVPRKVGIAKVTVTEREAEKLEIVVIVKEVRAGTEYIMTEEPVVQLSPGQINHPLQVRLVGGNDTTDLQDFEWQIYSQLPSDWAVAQNGGTVISLFGMGDRAAVSANYVGTARVRVSHPKAQLPLYIVVQVTNFESMAFNEKEALILNGDIYFAGIRVPNYENFTGKVEYSTDNPAACVVTGTDRVALLQSQGTGRAKITAIVRGTDLQASIDVQVIERDNFAEPNIIVPKTIYMLNPREKPFQIEAYLQGVGVTEENHYKIQWEAMLLSGGEIEKTIGMYPGELDDSNDINILRGTGPVIQIEVLNPPLPDGQKFETKEIVIMVSQPEITTRTKAVYIKIAEVSGMFTLNKLDISMEAQGMADLSCNILGGKTSDYKEVVWFAETDSVGREIVKIMGTGKDVQLLGVHDGTVYVTAMYRNEIAECRVQVKSSFYLKLQYEIFLTYPGARREGNQLIEVEYEVRPFTTQIMWTPQGPTPDADDPVARVLASTQNYENGKGKITIDPVKEGSFTLIGMTNRTTARMTVLIQNVYSMRISNNRFFMRLAETTRYEDTEIATPWDYESRYKYILVSDGGEDKIGDSIYIPFTFCPPDYLIGFDSDSLAKMEKYGIRHEISPLLRKSDLEGRGIIKLIATREIPRSEYGTNNNGIVLALEMKKPFEDKIIDPSLYSSNPNSPNNHIYIKCQLPLHKTAAIPVFQRVFGNYSNPNMRKYKYYLGNTDTNWKNETELTNNEQNTTGFDINNPTWYQNYPTGVLPQFNNQEYWTSTSEYMQLFSPYLIRNNEGHNVSYELELGDGEKHYILLDKTHDGMYYEFDDSGIGVFNERFKQLPFYKDNTTRAPVAQLVNLNGEQAIEISGGADFMVYDRIYVKKRKTHTFEYYFMSSGTQYGRDVSNNANIYNSKSQTNQFNSPIKGFQAMDYYLLSRYGVPLSTGYPNDGGIGYYDDGGGDAHYIINDDAILKDSIQYQIVYWREKNPNGSDGRPIRVRYNYYMGEEKSYEELLAELLEKFNTGEISGEELALAIQALDKINFGVGVTVGVIANDGNPVDFTNAKNYFKEGPLYVTKVDRGSEYYIESRTGGPESYYDNATISQIGITAINTDIYVLHNEMVEKNTHFDEVYDGALYIVSDFDLGAKEKLWYVNQADMWEKMAVGLNNSEKGPLLVVPGGRYKSGDYFRVYYNLFNRATGLSLGNRDFIYWDDEAETGGTGYTLNYYFGRYWETNYNSNTTDGSHFMFMPDTDHILKEKPGFSFRGVIGGSNILPLEGLQHPRPRYNNIITDIEKINYRAIISLLKHNNNTIISHDVLNNIKNATEFKTLYDGLTPAAKTAIRDLVLNGNDKGFIMGSQNQSTTNYADFNTRTLYVKFGTEENHNKAYPLHEFKSESAVDNFDTWQPMSGVHTYWHTLTNTNICDSDYYEPVASKSDRDVYTSPVVELSLRYKNSYSGETANNVINIRVIHKVRGNEATKNELVRTEWGKLEAVQSLTELDTAFQNENYSTIYSTYHKNYFFVPKSDGNDKY